MSGKLSKRLIYEYAQALQVLGLSARETSSPYTVSLLAILFKNSEMKPNLEVIRDWLCNYIIPYLYTDPRNQVDLREKTLAICVYYLIEDLNDTQHLLPNEFLNKYLDYASKQDWYNDTFLAFICGFLTDRQVIYQNAQTYFRLNYSSFLSKQNIAAISQALFLVPDLEEHQKASGYNIIRESIINPYAQVYEKSWGLLGISTSVGQEDLIFQDQLQKDLYLEISRITNDYFSQLVSQRQNNGVISEKNPNAEHNQRYTQVNSLNKIDNSHIIPFQIMDVAELSLISVCLLLSDNFMNLNITGLPETNVIEFINNADKTEKGFIQISKQANIIGNLLAILFTFIAGAIACVLLFGLTIKNDKMIFSSTPALSDLLILPIWADYLLSQIQALFRGESALEGMGEIPLLRHLGHFNKRKENK
jgi:hypothetical protein